MLQAKLIPFSVAEVNQMERSVPRIYLCMQAYSLLCYLAKGTRGLVIEAITYMRLSNFYGDDGSYLPLLPNSSERLGIAGGQGGRFFHRQLSSRCAMTTLTAAWADAGSCQAPTASIHVAEKKISIFPDSDLSPDTVGTGAEPAGLGARGFAAGAVHTKGPCAGADYKRC